MPKLRITVLLSVLAVLLGVAGTAWLSQWPRMRGAAEPAWVARAPASPPPPQARRSQRISPAAVTTPVAHAPPRARPLYTPPPRYPIAALRAHREGLVMLNVQLDGDGHVATADVAGSSGDRELDQAALDAVRRWTFQLPASASAQPQSLQLPVRFRIDGADGPG
jgi:protein TonB